MNAECILSTVEHASLVSVLLRHRPFRASIRVAPVQTEPEPSTQLAVRSGTEVQRTGYPEDPPDTTVSAKRVPGYDGRYSQRPLALEISPSVGGKLRFGSSVEGHAVGGPGLTNPGVPNTTRHILGSIRKR